MAFGRIINNRSVAVIAGLYALGNYGYQQLVHLEQTVLLDLLVAESRAPGLLYQEVEIGAVLLHEGTVCRYESVQFFHWRFAFFNLCPQCIE